MHFFSVYNKAIDPRPIRVRTRISARLLHNAPRNGK